MNPRVLNVTPNALNKFKDVIEDGDLEGQENALVREMIKARTPTEYEYTMGLMEKEEDPAEHMRDSFYDFDDITLVIDDVSIDYLKGSTIDYKEDVNAAGFVIDNHNTPERNETEKDCQQFLDDHIKPQVKTHLVKISIVRYYWSIIKQPLFS